MGAVKGFIWGATIGAGLVYAFDPELGRQRRERVRGQIDQARNKVKELRDLPARLKNASAETSGISSMDSRTLMAVASGVLSLYGFRPRNLSNLPLGLIGLALAYKALTNQSMLGEEMEEQAPEAPVADAEQMAQQATSEVG